MPSEVELAWIAGFLEGEGSFTFQGRDNRYPDRRPTSVRMTAEQKGSPETLERCATAFGGSVLPKFDKNYPENKYWRWHIGGDGAAVCMQAIYPHMSKRRKERITELLSAWATKPPRGVHTKVWEQRKCQA